MTLHLLPVMRESGEDCRIINVSSMGHAYGVFDPSDIQSEKKFDPRQMYSNSKLFQVRYLRFYNNCMEWVCIQGGVFIQGSLHPGRSTSRGGVCIQGDWADPPGLPRVGSASGGGGGWVGYYGIQSTSGRYAFHWNAFFLSVKWDKCYFYVGEEWVKQTAVKITIINSEVSRCQEILNFLQNIRNFRVTKILTIWPLTRNFRNGSVFVRVISRWQNYMGLFQNFSFSWIVVRIVWYFLSHRKNKSYMSFTFSKLL